jgi:hypothetical protein
VPISVRYQDGNKRNPVVHGLQVLDAMLSLVARRRPLAFVSVPGVILSCLGLLLGFLVAYEMDQTGQLMIGTAMVTVLLIVAGLLLGVTGVLLHSMGKFMDRLRDELRSLTSAIPKR